MATLRKYDLIGASLGWGAKRHEAALGPEVLKSANVLKFLQEKTDGIRWLETINSKIPYTKEAALSYSQRLALVAEFNDLLAKKIMTVPPTEHFPIVLGGDHAIAVGTWSGLIQALQAPKKFGLIWIDAHMDSHTPATTPSHAIHGMPLAALLGYGEESLVNVGFKGTKISPEHVSLIGVRSFEAGEAALLKSLNVKIYYMEEVKDRGLSVIFQEAVKRASLGTKGFGISIDLDAFDPLFTPGTGSPVAGGLSVEPLLQALSAIKRNPLLQGLEIAEFDPTLDVEHKTAAVIQDIIASIL